LSIQKLKFLVFACSNKPALDGNSFKFSKKAKMNEKIERKIIQKIQN